jgi:hypothetical protein
VGRNPLLRPQGRDRVDPVGVRRDVEGNPVPLAFATDIGQKQDAAIKSGLAG